MAEAITAWVPRARSCNEVCHTTPYASLSGTPQSIKSTRRRKRRRNTKRYAAGVGPAHCLLRHRRSSGRSVGGAPAPGPPAPTPPPPPQHKHKDRGDSDDEHMDAKQFLRQSAAGWGGAEASGRMYGVAWGAAPPVACFMSEPAHNTHNHVVLVGCRTGWFRAHGAGEARPSSLLQGALS